MNEFQTFVSSDDEDFSQYLSLSEPSQSSKKSYDNSDFEPSNFYNTNLDYLLSLNPASQKGVEKCTQKRGRNSQTKERDKSKEERNKLKEERNKLKDERLKERMRKAEARNCNARMKPGNCMKYVNVIIDSNLVNEKFGGEILRSIVQCGSTHHIKQQQVHNTITWTRNTLEENVEVEKEVDVVLLLWNTSHLLTSIKNNTLNQSIESVKDNLDGKRLTLAVFELDFWFSEQERLEKKKFKSRVANEQLEEMQTNTVTRDVVEEHIAELQILYDLSTFNVNKPEEVGELVARFTKSIAETPYKIELQKQQVEALGWSAVSELKDVVRVDKAGNGLTRLWLQQLRQFNNLNLDVAQAILQVYPTPSTLYKAYIDCKSQEEGEELLKDILVRRGLGEAAALRRVGPELSKKIFHFFTSRDKDFTLFQD